MELRRFGDPLFRPRTTPLLSFLAPSVPQSWWLITAPRPSEAMLAKSGRNYGPSFHTTARQSAEPPSTAADNPKSKRSPFRPRTNTIAARRNPVDSLSRSQSSQDLDLHQTVSSLLDQAINNLPNSAKKGPSTPSDSLPESDQRERSSTSAQSSLDMLRNSYGSFLERERAPRVPGQLARQMQFPSAPAPGSDPSQSLLPALQHNIRRPVRARLTIRSRPSVGRTIEVNKGREQDLGKALKRLDVLCAVNRVRQDQARQRFHERPGLKRKRLKSERWRRLFKESFKATVARVQEMRIKGW